MSEVDSDFDWACRRLVKLVPTQFLPWLLTSFDLFPCFVRWEDARSAALPGMPQGIRDTIARLEDRLTRLPWLMLSEFQRLPDPDMFGRLLVYMGTAWLELRPDPLPGSRYHLAAAVVNLTGTEASQPATRVMVLPGPDGVTCTLQVRERYLQTESAEKLLAQIRTGTMGRGLLPLVVLMQVDDLEVAVASWLELWAAEPNQYLRNELVVLARVLADASDNRDRWRRALEGLGAMKSAFLEEVRNEARVEARKEGRIEAQAAYLLQVLRMRFPGQIPAEMESRIRAATDDTALERWFTAALVATSTDDFLRSSGL